MRLRISLERSILLISSTLFIRLMRCPEDRDIFFRQSATRSLSSIWTAASSVMPMIAFIGVRMSWLMAERNSLLPRLASSARASASLSSSFLRRSSASMSVTSARSIQTVLRFLSPHKILICLYRTPSPTVYGTTKSYPAGSFCSLDTIVSRLNCVWMDVLPSPISQYPAMSSRESL